MKILPFILLLAVVSCDRTGQRAEQQAMLRKTTAEVLQWVPMGTSLASARQTMEQHQFSCSVSSYDSLEQMKLERPKDIDIWKEIILKDHASRAVTNVTYLECTQGQLGVLLRLVNGETMGIYSVQLPWTR